MSETGQIQPSPATSIPISVSMFSCSFLCCLKKPLCAARERIKKKAVCYMELHKTSFLESHLLSPPLPTTMYLSDHLVVLTIIVSKLIPSFENRSQMSEKVGVRKLYCFHVYQLL